MTKLSVDEKEDLMRRLAAKHPLFATISAMMESMPGGVRGMLEIEENIEELKQFKGSDEEFSKKLREQRKNFRRAHGLDDEDGNEVFTEEEHEKFEKIAKVVKIITQEK